MNNFNSSRYINYAKWDLTINRKFYTNMFIVLAAAVLSVVLISFMFRWFTFEVMRQNGAAELLLDDRLWRTSMYVLTVGIFAIAIMSGCMLHPLRNKQGRITHLTLPATSLEKYAWHFTICIFGTIAAFLAATAVCDGLNALASYFVFGSQYTGSILGEFFTRNFFSPENIIAASIPIDASNISADEFTMAINDHGPIQFVCNIFSQLGWMIFSGMIFSTGLYAIFNSIIYKYNIPVTYILRQIASVLLSVIVIVIIICIGHGIHQGNISEESVRSFFENINGWITAFNILDAICGIAMWIGAYFLYKKAQISSKFNK